MDSCCPNGVGLAGPGRELYSQLLHENAREYEVFLRKLLAIRQDWEYFVTHGRISDNGVVRVEVLSSWQRCRDRGIDPFNSHSSSLTSKALKARLKENRGFLDIAVPLLEALVESIKGSGFRVDLFDKDLYLLVQYGDKDVLRISETRGSFVGVCRNEASSGTNAINLAALLGKPVQLVGPEHYNEQLHYWTCSAAPVFSSEGEMLGVINIAGQLGLRHQHTLGMVMFLAKAIEYSLRQRKLTAEVETANKYIRGIIESMTEGLMVVDEKGQISLINKVASVLLNLDPTNVVGAPIEEVLGPGNPFSGVHRRGEPLVDREIVMDLSGKRRTLVGTIRSVENESGVKGVVGVFRSINTAKGFIKNLTGLKAHFTFEDLIGESDGFKRAVQLAQQAAQLPSNILLQGESGTGKELFAQAIHNASPYCDGPFVALNCAAIPSELIESELFGYEGGAFTGARKEGRPGKFELAEGGTLFLDEISSMPLNMQAKLLRALQNKSIMRVGGLVEIPFSARIVAATNQDLWSEVRLNNFREDLFYRINVVSIFIPPLRERREDIPLLVNHLCAKHGNRLKVELSCSEEAMGLLLSYNWPGNVRELENVIERSAVMAISRGSYRIEKQDIVNYPGIREHTSFQQDPRCMTDVPANGVLSQIERDAIINALRATGGNVSKAAKVLGIPRNTLYRKMSRYRIESQRPHTN